MAGIGFVALSSNEIVGLECIEITTIPHISLWGKDTLDDLFVKEHQANFQSILSEMNQLYKENIHSKFNNELVSAELLLISEEVTGQINQARIRMFIAFRMIGTDRQHIQNQMDYLIQSTLSVLRNRKYEAQTVDVDKLTNCVKATEDDSIIAIVKEEKLVNLNNQLMPMCYSFDTMLANGDISDILNTMIQFPKCAFSIQLMPTSYLDYEKQSIQNSLQMLDTLSKGVMDHSIGMMSFSQAEKPAQTYKYYSDTVQSSLFLFNCMVWGNERGASMIVSRIISYFTTSDEGTTGLHNIYLSAEELGKDVNYYPMPWAINELLLSVDRLPYVDRSREGYVFNRLPYIISINEASLLFNLPVASTKVYAGFNVNESKMDSRSYVDGIIDSGDINIGMLKSANLQHSIGLSLNDLTKHMLVVGTPGSGKTTFSVGLLDRLWKQHGIPFLVIEPAKNEYRALVQSIPDLQVFTPGKNYISPFVFNPFVPPKNVRLETYKSTLKTAFAAAVSMSTPLDKIFEESISNCYSDFRWLDSYTVDSDGTIFNISDFVKCFQETFEAIGYTGDAKNIGRAGVVRLNSLATLFDNYFSIPIEDMLTKPTIIELAAIENSDQKALIIALLLLSILAYVNSNYVGEGNLKNVILLEEAHVLLDADTNAGQGDANPSSIAQGLVKRMLAEIRSYGVGIIIADQSPRKVTTDVVALTDIKVAFRLVEAVDKQILSESTNMSDIQTQRLAKLKPGEAFLFFNKLDEPEEVKTPNYRIENKISISLSDDGIKALSTYWNDKVELLRPYPECSYIKYCSHSCDYDRRILAKEIARRIYVRHFKPETKDFETITRVFARISQLVRDELNNEPFSQELLGCVKLHLWRRIYYQTKIRVSKATIQKSLEKS